MQFQQQFLLDASALQKTWPVPLFTLHHVLGTM
jgi:hypothetical protein